MTDTIVCGIDHHREWMLQVISCDRVTGASKDFMWFFNTREEAEASLKQLDSSKTIGGLIVKIVKVQAFEHLGLDFESIGKEN